MKLYHPLILLILIFSWAVNLTSLQASELNCACSQTINLSDATCTSPYDCLSEDGCAVSTFTASCSGQYSWKVWLTCTAGSCSNYNVCANIRDSNGNIVGANGHINPCTDCQDQCTPVCLERDEVYKLYVCLTSCLGTGSCPSPVTCAGHCILEFCGTETHCQ